MMIRRFGGTGRLTIRLLPCGILSILLAGCADDSMNDLKTYIGEVRQRKSSLPPEVLAGAPPAAVMPRMFAGEVRNPFLLDPVAKAPLADPGYQAELSRPREALEAYELGSLRMVGAVRRDGLLYGLVRDPAGTVHTVGIGTRLGRHRGRIAAMNESAIALVELTQDDSGAWRERKVILGMDAGNTAKTNP